MKTMRYFFNLFPYFVVMAICFLSSCIYANTQASAAMQLSRLLNTFTTFQAQFTQETRDANQQLLQKSRGTVQLMRPGNFRWETQKPSHQIVITNGKTLWIYDVDLQEVSVQSVDKGPMTPAQLLSTHVNALLKKFIVREIPTKNAQVFHLIPKKLNQQFRSVSIAFVSDKLHSMQIQNNLAQTTEFVFSHSVVNAHLSSTLFNFKAPKGVDVLQ